MPAPYQYYQPGSINFGDKYLAGKKSAQDRKESEARMEAQDLQNIVTQQNIDKGARAAKNEIAGQKLTDIKNALQIDDAKTVSLFKDARTAGALLELSPDRALDFLSNRIGVIEQTGRDPQDTLEIKNMILSGDIEGAKELLGNVVKAGIDADILQKSKSTGRTARQREFDSLTAGLTQEQVDKAKLIELGLTGRAVGSALQTITDQGIAEEIGKSKGIIKGREKFGELSAKSRAEAIDSGFERMTKIDAGVRNIDKALIELGNGAGVGAIQKYLPSFKASSVALDNIRNSMALDVVGATTFGALSEGELNLAKSVALPTGLDTPQLIQHLKDRKTAQNKLKNYYMEQIQFLDQGGSVAEFLKAKSNEFEASNGQPLPENPSGLSQQERDELAQLRKQFGGQ